MSRIKSKADIEILREGGRRLATIMHDVVSRVAPGVAVVDLDTYAREQVVVGGDKPAFLNYTPAGANRPYPAGLCVSTNEEVVHGIPTEGSRVLEEGDVVTLDMGVQHNGLFVDMAHTVAVGTVDHETQQLIAVAEEARDIAIAQAIVGNTTGDIGHAVETFVTSRGFSVPTDLGGHGVGHAVHEDPFIPNAGTPGTGTQLEAGMVLAIEPIVIVGKGAVKLLDDGYTFVSKDGTRSAQFEHTVLVTDQKPEILTHR